MKTNKKNKPVVIGDEMVRRDEIKKIESGSDKLWLCMWMYTCDMFVVCFEVGYVICEIKKKESDLLLLEPKLWESLRPFD